MRRTILFLLLSPALASCTTLPPPAAVSALVGLPQHRGDGSVTVNGEGFLERRGDCILLTRMVGERRYYNLVIWPEGTRFDGRFLVVQAHRPEGEVTRRVGGSILLEGNAPDWSERLLTIYPSLARWRAACPYPPFFAEGVRRHRDR
ncbi:hypothetical protein [Sphingomonas sp. LHG3443-2]|uniref:hypothetical protein n=1 Tax=Sphingomonas sp. LHG3443-2 TaxID=2804639 RepID=UPI003CE86AC6